MTLPVVAVVGRPNVGKSTLFNRLIGFQKAVVHDRPGVTRDRLYEEASINDHRVLLVDTGGIESETESDLSSSMRKQSLIAVEEANVIVFVVDGRAGITPDDLDVADMLRKSHKPVVLTVNKIDGLSHEAAAAEFFSFGIHPLQMVSAAHGRGIFELCSAITELLPEGASTAERPEEGEPLGDLAEETFDVESFELGEEPSAEDGAPQEPRPEAGTAIEDAEEEPCIKIAVVGRPNIGKSTLVNALLGEDRHVVDDAPGTTMDPIDSRLFVDEKQYLFVDTAGVRRKSKIDDELERWVTLRAIRSIERCHVSLLLIDGTEGVTEQDARLAQLVVDRGRALIILVNKWDLARGNEAMSAQKLEEQLDAQIPHAIFAPRLFISARTGKGLHRVLPAISAAYAEFDKRIETSRLNRFLESAVHAHTPPQRHHHPVKLYYATQTRVRPPTFAFFSNTPDGIGPAYRRYLTNRLRDEFGFMGTPLRLQFRRRRKLGEEGAET